MAVVGIAACDQGEGDFCQFTSDCEDGLTCNQSSHRCQAGTVSSDGGSGVDAPLDAGVLIDATEFDAPPAFDAPGPDAPP